MLAKRRKDGYNWSGYNFCCRVERLNRSAWGRRVFPHPVACPLFMFPTSILYLFWHPVKGRGADFQKRIVSAYGGGVFRLLWALFFCAQNEKWAEAQRLVRWAYPPITGSGTARQGFGRAAAKLAAISALWKLSALKGGAAPGIACPPWPLADPLTRVRAFIKIKYCLGDVMSTLIFQDKFCIEKRPI